MTGPAAARGGTVLLAGLASLARADSVLDPAGPTAAAIAWQAIGLFAGGAAIFVAVMALLACALGAAGRGRIRRTLQARPAAWILAGGVVFPLLVLGALLADSVRRTDRLQAQPPDALVIGITARMWWWEVRYPAPGGEGAPVVSANELHLPAGRDVRLALDSGDVIHSFWVPALAGKLDMLPGRLAHLPLRAGRPGVYRAQCAEFCGEQHARMALPVVVQPADEFEAWLARQAQPAPAPRQPAAQRGRELFAQLRCGACHRVHGVNESLGVGPDLTHLHRRLTLGAGVLPNSPQMLRAWIGAVQHHKPGARMPSFRELGAAELDALAAWLGAAE